MAKKRYQHIAPQQEAARDKLVEVVRTTVCSTAYVDVRASLQRHRDAEGDPNVELYAALLPAAEVAVSLRLTEDNFAMHARQVFDLALKVAIAAAARERAQIPEPRR